jgi:hypothetical protein
MSWQGPIIAAAAREAKVMHAMDRQNVVHHSDDDSSRRLGRRLWAGAATAIATRRHGCASNAKEKSFASRQICLHRMRMMHMRYAQTSPEIARFCLNHSPAARAIMLDIPAVFPYFICTQSMKTEQSVW